LIVNPLIATLKPAFDAPLGGFPSGRSINAVPFDVEKLEWCGYPM